MNDKEDCGAAVAGCGCLALIIVAAGSFAGLWLVLI